jgi:hypothetical protein
MLGQCVATRVFCASKLAYTLWIGCDSVFVKDNSEDYDCGRGHIGRLEGILKHYCCCSHRRLKVSVQDSGHAVRMVGVCPVSDRTDRSCETPKTSCCCQES